MYLMLTYCQGGLMMVNWPNHVVNKIKYYNIFLCLLCLKPEIILLSCNLFLLGEQKIEANTEGKIYFFTLMRDSLIKLISNWVRIFAVLMHLSIKNRAFVPMI
jgi:hypothetical protein